MPASAPEAPATPAPAFGIYVHWPFCRAKCPYCDFNSHVATAVDDRRWARALCAELDHFAARARGRTVTSVYFGGGTPSLMAPATVATVIDRVRRNWPVDRNVEITLEANPTSAEAARFAAYRAAGVNRLSLGVQALDDDDLRRLGRGHDRAEAVAAVDLARRHAERVSIDLIYARPGQEPAAWRHELGRALSLPIDHVSLYQLTVEPGTAFGAAHRRGELELPDDERTADLFEVTQEACGAAGLPAYEVSNHAPPGRECRHNLTYWRSEDYVGIGPGAHGRIAGPGPGASRERRAIRQTRSPEAWLAAVESRGHATEEDRPLSVSEHAAETLLMGLRLTEGIELADFARRLGRPLVAMVDEAGLRRLAEGGFLRLEGGRLAATERGRRVLNAVLAELLAERRPTVS